MAQDDLTKEAFMKLFPDLFQLTHHAIDMAQQQIRAGKEDFSVSQLLKEIRKAPSPQHEMIEEE